MPFAVVQGQPQFSPPKDLYIPPDALEVFLDAFEGPLDLLLYLIRRQNLDILDIPITQITEQYMEYIEMLHDMQFELAAEYLVMAAILAEIKSRMLLPRPKTVDGREVVVTVIREVGGHRDQRDPVAVGCPVEAVVLGVRDLLQGGGVVRQLYRATDLRRVPPRGEGIEKGGKIPVVLHGGLPGGAGYGAR